MSIDRFTEVKQQSWLSRLAGAVYGVFFGLALLLGGFVLLFWNEGRAVKRAQTLNEGGKIALSVPCDKVDPANAGKLIHVTGRATTDATLKDELFGVTAQALKLERLVEMYQWEERKTSSTRKKFGGGSETVTTYDYNRTWARRVNNSAEFHYPDGHQNPDAMPYGSETWVAHPVMVGAFQLTPELLNDLNGFTPLAIPSAETLSPELKSKAKVNGTGYYIGADPGAPKVGDLRISFLEVKPMEVSVVARQVNNTFEPYQTKAGGTIQLLQTGTVSAEAMFQSAQRSNTYLTWGLRVAGFAILAFGISLIFGPLSVLADIVPFIGNIVAMGTGAIALLLGSALSLVTIALAWLAYRPLLAVVLFAGAGGLALLLILKSAGKKKKLAASEPQA